METSRKKVEQRLVRRAGPAAFALLTLIGACERQHEPYPTISEPRIARDVGTAPKSVRPAEAAFAALAENVPSSAGFIYDRDGNMVVFVRDSVDMPQAEPALRLLATTKRIHLGADKRHMPGVIVQRADYTFWQLAVWRDTIGNYVDNHAGIGVVMLDLNEARNRLTVGVLPSADRGQLLASFEALGVDKKAVEFEETKGIRPASGAATLPSVMFHPSAVASMMSLPTLNDNASQLIGGLEIGMMFSDGSRHSCTLSFPAQENQNGIATTGFVTASHCTENLFAYDGDAFYQAALGNLVGHEKDDPQGYRCGVYICNVSDAAFVQTTAGTNVGIGLLAKGTGDGGKDYDPSNLWIVTQVENNDIYVNEWVSWIGAVSGFQFTSIQNTCVDFWHDWSWTHGEFKTTCEDMTYGTAQNGDSGGAVYVSLGTGNEVEALGLISGDYMNTSGEMSFTRITRIQSDFGSENGTIAFMPPPPPSPTFTLDGSQVDASGHPSLSWTSYPGALNYDVYRRDIDASCNDVTSGTGLIFSTTGNSYVDVSVISGGTTICPSAEYYIVATTSNSLQQSNTVTYSTQ